MVLKGVEMKISWAKVALVGQAVAESPNCAIIDEILFLVRWCHPY